MKGNLDFSWMRKQPPAPPAERTQPPSKAALQATLLDGYAGVYLGWVNDKDFPMDALPDDYDTSPKRVLIAANTLSVGGAERLAVDMGEALRKAGHTVTFGLVADGSLERAVEEQEFDVALLSNLNGAKHTVELSEKGCKVVGIPYGLTRWNVQQLDGCPGAAEKLTFWGYPKLCSGMKQLGLPGKCYPMRGFTDVDVARIPCNPSAGPVLAFVGRISPEKNLRATLQLAISLLAPLHIVGGVDESATDIVKSYFQKHLDDLKALPEFQQAESLGLLHMHGYCPNPWDVLADVHPTVVVLTSDFEGEPLVFLEAMARGILCAGRGVCSVTELLDGHGVLTVPEARSISPGELMLMAGKITLLHRRPDTYEECVNEARGHVVAFHSPEAWLDSFHRLCAALGGGR